MSKRGNDNTSVNLCADMNFLPVNLTKIECFSFLFLLFSKNFKIPKILSFSVKILNVRKTVIRGGIVTDRGRLLV